MDLPYLTNDAPGTGGVIRSTDDDFFVDEEPAYRPAGTGDHVFVRIEKRGMTTRHATTAIARALGIAERDIGVAGMKDRHAVTRQWLSLPPPITPEAALALAVDNVAILEATRHPHKLRTGHVRANMFRIRIRSAVPDAAARARAILAHLVEAPGAPNWYGEQRFGKSGDNAARGRAIVLGTERMPRDKKLARLLVSALQSELFNAWLVARLADGLYRQVLVGDVLHKRAGGMFVCEDVAADQPRLLAGELAITGPMFGERMRRPPDGSAAATRENTILAASGLAPGAFAAVRAIAEGTRRDATIEVRDALVTEAADSPGTGPTLDLAFALPGGAYATAVLREVMKTVPQRVDDTPEPA